MALEVTSEQNRAMVDHAEEAYPHECCGFLLGGEEEGVKIVRRVRAAANQRDDSPQNRYLIDPREFMNVDREARAAGCEIVGIYHSHPDHPARPSEFDREHAWPYYSYIILSVEQGKVVAGYSWLLDDNRGTFQEESVKGLGPF